MADDDVYTDPAGYEIHLGLLRTNLEKLDQATAYLVDDMKKLSALAGYVMGDLVGDGSPDQSAGRHAFADLWDTAARRLLRDRETLIESVRGFTDTMHDVYDTYEKAETGNAAHFRALTDR